MVPGRRSSERGGQSFWWIGVSCIPWHLVLTIYVLRPCPLPCSSIRGSCSTLSGLICSWTAPATCTSGQIWDASLEACCPCQIGTYEDNLTSSCLAW